MNGESAVIFGRSPFINQVDVPRLIERYSTVGFNQFGQHYETDYLFFFDQYFYSFKGAPQVFIPEWFPAHHAGTRYASKRVNKPILSRQTNKRGNLVLGHKYFTTSLALNWLILQGYKTAYLVGVDHIETDKQFRHHDNQDLPSRLEPFAHQEFKRYVKRCLPYIDIVQTNSAVKNQWELPFLDVKCLY